MTGSHELQTSPDSVTPEPVPTPPASAGSTVARLAFVGALYSTGSTYLLQLGGLGVGIVLARLVAPVEFGVLALAVTIYEILSRVRLFGFGQIMLAKPTPDAEDWATHLALALGLSLVTLGLTVAALPLLSLWYDGTVLTVLLVIAGLALFDQDGLMAVPDTYLQKGMRYQQIAQLDVVAGVLSMAAAVGAAAAGWGVWALVTRQGVNILARCAGAWLLSGWRPSQWPTWQRAKGLLRAGAHLWTGGVSSLISFRYDDFLLGTVAGVTSLGYYARAFDYAKLPMGPLAGIYAVALPTFARLQADRRLLSRAYNVLLDSIVLFALPASVWLAVAAPEFVDGLLGPAWRPMIPLIRLMLPFAILRPFLDGTGGVPVVTGKPQVRSKQAILESVVMLVAGTILILRYGAIGATISASVVVLATLVGLYFWYVRDSLDINWRRTFLVPVLAIAVAAAISAWSGLWAPEWSALARLALKTAVFGAVFVSLILVFHRAVIKETYRLIVDVWGQRTTT